MRSNRTRRPVLYWHCSMCGTREKAQPEYERGDTEPCTECDGGTAKVRTLSEIKSLRWRCFYCDQVFLSWKEALEHFGPGRVVEKPLCQEDGRRLRQMEVELARYREEDTDLHREISRLRADHALDVQRAEEKGYARGLKDAAAGQST